MLAELREAPARIARGWERTFARPEGSEGQLAQERETAVSLGLMAAAASAGAAMTDEQAIFLSASQKGMRDRVARLLDIPNRSLAQDRELVMIQRELARIEGRDEGPPVLVRRQAPAALGLLPAMPAIGMLGAVRPWMLWAGAVGLSLAWGGVQSARLDNAKGDLREARQDMTQAQEERDAWKDRAEQYAQAVTDARAAAQQTAQALEAERRRIARAAERERRRQREIQDVLTGGDAPAWSLRDDQPVQE